jgi:hypothetical protein
VTSIYLSPDNPRWAPKTEADLQAAIDGGWLEEGHHLDLKEACPSSKGANKEMARDLASFAVNGGTLIFGVREDKTNRVFELAPQPLHGLPEKAEQVARAIPDPALQSSPSRSTRPPVTAPATSSSTYRPAPAAPHMVDGQYYGRGDKTKHRLSDAEVVALHPRRRTTETDGLALLRKEMDTDPLRDVGTESHRGGLARRGSTAA